MVSVEDGCLESRSGLKREVELGFLCELKSLLLQVSTACCPDSRAQARSRAGKWSGALKRVQKRSRAGRWSEALKRVQER